MPKLDQKAYRFNILSCIVKVTTRNFTSLHSYQQGIFSNFLTSTYPNCLYFLFYAWTLRAYGFLPFLLCLCVCVPAALFLNLLFSCVISVFIYWKFNLLTYFYLVSFLCGNFKWFPFVWMCLYLCVHVWYIYLKNH